MDLREAPHKPRVDVYKRQFFVRGIVFPVDADLHTWAWFAMTGLIGCALGDMCLFKAYVEIGPRITLLIMSAAPPLTALMGFFILGERVSIRGLTGMVITMAGICLVILSRDPDDEMVRLNRPVRGDVYKRQVLRLFLFG